MKNIAVLLINFYQYVISVFLKNLLGVQAFCRFDETCSQYAKTSIQNNGLVRGLGLSIRRIIICQPFYPAPFSRNSQFEPPLRDKKVLGL